MYVSIYILGWIYIDRWYSISRLEYQIQVYMQKVDSQIGKHEDRKFDISSFFTCSLKLFLGAKTTLENSYFEIELR